MPPPYTAFFYGTLMHPRILTKVIHNGGGHLEICPAVLLDHTRHRVKNAEYPGVVPYERGRQLFSRDLEQEERSVRGTLVRGLTLTDIGHLDIFEGDEYERLSVSVHPLAAFNELSTGSSSADSLIPQHATPLPPVQELPEAIDVHTYIFQDLRFLEPTLWSWDEFVKKNAWKWYAGAPEAEAASPIIVGEGVGDDADIPEVERRRAAMIAGTALAAA
ncbi:hypothetical protein DFP72DRAFT_809609 [Ephemerocybe angulata]|uniref:Putative gamma-glutamylcyclotransferase n=1 Tax=Ephemerocybe angulata TaxID=980116 RepID=A0A8H6I1P3_9AGAR|nr:hypothetical protein DFP72DRAFT_809609 [Tulosesus angulatus]